MRTIVFWLSMLLIFIIPWENAGNIPGVTLSRPLGLFVAALWLVMVIITGRIRELSLFHLAVFLFVSWNIVSILWSINVNETTQHAKTYLQLMGLVALIWDLYSTKIALKAALQAYVLGSYVCIYSMIDTYLTLGDDFSRTIVVGGFNLNDLGTIVVLAMPLAWYLGTSPVNRKTKAHLILRLVNFAFIPAACWCVLLTASRSASFSLLIVFLFILGSLTRLKLSARLSILALLIVAMFALQPFIPQQSVERLESATDNVSKGDLNERQYIWAQGLDVFLTHPVIGVGSKGFSSAIEYGKSPHNLVLGIMVDTGLIGLALFMWILALVIYQALRQPKWEARLWLAIILIWLMGALTHNLEYKKQTWLLFTLIGVSEREERRSQSGIDLSQSRQGIDGE